MEKPGGEKSRDADSAVGCVRRVVKKSAGDEERGVVVAGEPRATEDDAHSARCGDDDASCCGFSADADDRRSEPNSRTEAAPHVTALLLADADIFGVLGLPGVFVLPGRSFQNSFLLARVHEWGRRRCRLRRANSANTKWSPGRRGVEVRRSREEAVGKEK
jgi:hypothetical protein